MINYIEKNSTIFNAFSMFNKLGLKTIVVSNSNNKLLGVLSDGDLRRAILKKYNLSAKILRFPSKNLCFQQIIRLLLWRSQYFS